MKLKFLLIVSLIFASYSLFGQYFVDSTFKSQLEDFMKPLISQNKEYQAELQSFLLAWDNDLLSQHWELLRTFNILYDKHIPRLTIIKIISVYNELTGLGKLDFLNNWNINLQNILTQQFSKLSAYVDYMRSLLKDSVITYNERLTLKIKDGDFDFSFDNNKNIIVKSLGEISLSISYAGDTVIINRTQGKYYSHRHFWQGYGGIIRWTKFDNDTGQSYVSLNGYKIYANSLDFKIDTVRMNIDNGIIKASDLAGTLELRFSPNPKIQEKSPIFRAKDSLKISNIVPDGDFFGLLTVSGKFVNLSGSFLFKLADTTVIKVKSSDFRVSGKFIKTRLASLYVKLSNRGIEHPNINMLLLYDTTLIMKMYPFLAGEIFELDTPRILSFYRDDKGPASQPFYDDYHKLKIVTSEVLWTFGNKLYFVQTPKTSTETPYFESVYFYNPQLLSDFIDPNGVNYAALFYQFLRKKNFPDTVWLNDFFKYVSKRGVKTTRKFLLDQLYKMSWRGWLRIKYSSDPNLIYIYDINDVYKHIIRAESRVSLVKRRKFNLLDKYSDDFDIIKIEAEPVFDTLRFLRKLNNYTLRYSGIVAILDLQTYFLRILKPKPFYLSRVRKVKIFADTLKFKKDLDFVFDGKVEAGLTVSKGEDFEFDYQEFKLNLNHVKTMNMWFWNPIDSTYLGYTIDKNGDTNEIYEYKYQLDTVISTLRNFKAMIKIDSSGNKSGLLAKEGDGYPIYRGLTNSKIYYSGAPVDTSHFYFLNYPFELKDLKNLTKESVAMVGLFRSSILEDIDSLKLTVQRDNSLGFIKYDTVQGFEILGAAKLLGYLQLDDKGLHSVADLQFLSTKAKGSFILKPDTLSGTIDTMIIQPVDDKLKEEKGYPARFPLVTFGGKADMLLYENRDSTQTMEVRQLSKKGFALYPNFLKGDERGYLDKGHLIIDYSGVRAEGVMDFIDAQLISNDFSLDYDNFSADSCKFVYKDSTFKESLFNTDNVSCYMDLVTRVGTFVANDVNNYITFPKNRYIVYSDHFLWKINEGLIDIGGDMANPNFIVVGSEEERDSLLQTGKYNPKMIRLSGTRLVSMKKKNPVNFQAARSVYEPRKTVLVAYDVPELKIADTRIIPSTPVVIRIGGYIDSLKNARLYIGKYEHKITDAQVYIKDSKYYSASGVYFYQDTQQIYFNPIAPTQDTITYGYARLKPGQRIFLNKYFYYTGAASYNKITLKGNRPFLHFSGNVGIYSECDTLKPRQIAVDQEIDPDTVMLKVDYPIKGRVGTLTAAPLIHKVGTYRYELWNTFLTRPPNFQVDRILSKVEGYLYYNPSKAYYIIGTKEKVLNPDTSLPMVAFDYKRCFLFSENRFDFHINYGQDLKYDAVGKYRADLQNDKNVFKGLILKFDFPYPDRIFSLIEKDLNNMEYLEYLDFDNDKDFKRAIMLWAQTPEDRQNFIESGILPQSMSGTIVLADVDLIWDKNRSSFRTPKENNRFALLYLNGKEQDVFVNGYIELRYERKRLSRIYIYMDLGDGTYYFFRYLFDGRNGYMNILSSSGKAERFISQLDKKSRQLTKHFEIGTAEKDELARFLRLYGQNL